MKHQEHGCTADNKNSAVCSLVFDWKVCGLLVLHGPVILYFQALLGVVSIDTEDVLILREWGERGRGL